MTQDFRKLTAWVEETLKTSVAEERKLLELTRGRDSQEPPSNPPEVPTKAR